MAVKVTAVQAKAMNAVEILSKTDDAIDMEKSEWEEYTKTLDEKHLVFVPDLQPTRFICNFEFNSDDAKKIKNHMLGGKDEDGKPTFAFGDWASEVTRRSLKDIQQPDYLKAEEKIEFKKDSVGFVGPKTMSLLERYGIVDEIFSHYSRLILQSTRAQAKKS